MCWWVRGWGWVRGCEREGVLVGERVVIGCVREGVLVCERGCG